MIMVFLSMEYIVKENEIADNNTTAAIGAKNDEKAKEMKRRTSTALAKEANLMAFPTLLQLNHLSKITEPNAPKSEGKIKTAKVTEGVMSMMLLK